MTDSNMTAVTRQGMAWAEINLDAIAHNVRLLKQCVGEQVQLMAVVKANAYGHGALPVARTALQQGATYLAVARSSEGVELRRNGISAPILVLGYTPAAAVGEALDYQLTLTVADLEVAAALSTEALRRTMPMPMVHIKVDTGMGRFGVLPEDALALARSIAALPGVKIEGVFTHLATADEPDKSYSLQQHRVFMDVLAALRQAGIPFSLAHEANSAATLSMPDTRLDIVRCGIALYGLPPCVGFTPQLDLWPALSLHSRVGRVTILPAGSCISYGCTYVTERLTRVALVCVGYGDGYHRLVSNRGAVLIHGQRCPVLGRVCMDQIVVDATAVPDACVNEEVVVFGRQGGGEIRADEVAAWAETINYEVTTSLTPRVPRLYLQGGQAVGLQLM